MRTVISILIQTFSSGVNICDKSWRYVGAAQAIHDKHEYVPVLPYFAEVIKTYHSTSNSL